MSSTIIQIASELRLNIYELYGVKQVTAQDFKLILLSRSSNRREEERCSKSSKQFINFLKPLRQSCRLIRHEVDGMIIESVKYHQYNYHYNRLPCWRPHGMEALFVRQIEINFFPNGTSTFLHQFYHSLQAIGRLHGLEHIRILIGTEWKRNLAWYFRTPKSRSVKAEQNRLDGRLQGVLQNFTVLQSLVIESVHMGRHSIGDSRAVFVFKRDIIPVVENTVQRIYGDRAFRIEADSRDGYGSIFKWESV